MPTNRQIKLLELLKQDNSYQSISSLAKKLGYSERTLYSDIKFLRDIGIKILTKRGEGVKLDNDDYNDKYEAINPILLRRVEIMEQLLLKNKIITLKQLSEKYFVSQSSVKYDLKQIEKILSNGIEFRFYSDHNGTRVRPKNLNQKISLLFNFNQYVMEHASELEKKEENNDIDILTHYYSENIVRVCKNVLYTFIKKNIMTIPDIYTENFLSIFISFVSQLIEGKHFREGRDIFEKHQHSFYVSNAVTLLHNTSSRLSFDYTNGDVEFLSQMLLNYKFEQFPTEQIDDGVVIKLIEKVSNSLDVDFLKDKQLIEQLKIHIPAMLYRLKLHTPVKNPFTEQIKLEFSITYNVLWIVMEDFSQEIGITFNEDEIAFLTIYFQLSLEKIGQSRKILIVCQMGIITSELLITRIKNILPSLDEIKVASVYELDELNISTYDLILTTLKTNSNAENVYYISPFASNEVLLSLLNRPQVKVDYMRFRSSSQKNFPIYYPMLNQHFNSKEDLLVETSKKLEDEGFVTNKFSESLLERERLGSTEFPLGVAIPHGKPSFVNKTFVAVITLITKIKWYESFVDTIFLVGIAKKDMEWTREIVSNIYRFINDKEELKKLKNKKSNKEVVKILYGKN